MLMLHLLLGFFAVSLGLILTVTWLVLLGFLTHRLLRFLLTRLRLLP